MSNNRKETVKWSKHAYKYDPIQIGSIDGKVLEEIKLPNFF